jgi:hypothetical protein
VTPTSKSLDRDRLFTIADDSPLAACNSNAKMLVYNAPCHTTGSDVKPVCRHAARNLQLCPCSGEGTTMIEEPCRNTLNPPECQATVSTLYSCQSPP